jgi:hypothetical protein
MIDGRSVTRERGWGQQISRSCCIVLDSALVLDQLPSALCRGVFIGWAQCLSTKVLMVVWSSRTTNVFRFAATCVSKRIFYCTLRGAGIAPWYSTGLRAGWSGVRVSIGASNFSPHHSFQTGCMVHPVSYAMGTRGSFPGIKLKLTTHLQLVPRLRRWAIPPQPTTPSWHGAQLKRTQRQLYLWYCTLHLLLLETLDQEV